jgi:hypothetical protein
MGISGFPHSYGTRPADGRHKEGVAVGGARLPWMVRACPSSGPMPHEVGVGEPLARAWRPGPGPGGEGRGPALGSAKRGSVRPSSVCRASNTRSSQSISESSGRNSRAGSRDSGIAPERPISVPRTARRVPRPVRPPTGGTRPGGHPQTSASTRATPPPRGRRTRRRPVRETGTACSGGGGSGRQRRTPTLPRCGRGRPRPGPPKVPRPPAHGAWAPARTPCADPLVRSVRRLPRRSARAGGWGRLPRPRHSGIRRAAASSPKAPSVMRGPAGRDQTPARERLPSPRPAVLRGIPAHAPG